MKTRLRELRKSYGLTLRELDEKVNINYSQLARIERGEGSLTQQHIQILSSFFNVSSDYLLGINDNSNNSIVAEKIPVYSELYGGNQVLRKEHLMYHSFAPGNIDLHDCVYLQASNDNKEESISSGDLSMVIVKKMQLCVIRCDFIVFSTIKLIILKITPKIALLHK